MTVLTKASDMARKPDLMTSPLVMESGLESSRASPRPAQRTHVWVYRSQCSLFMLCFTLFTAVTLLAGAVLGLVYYSDSRPDSPRYKGYCSIPIEVPRDLVLQRQAQQAQASARALHWTAEPDLMVLTAEDQRPEGLLSLLERFDIDDNVERISVYNSGRNIEFIHDFSANASGIVDKARCFTMELDAGGVLAPRALVLGIMSGAQFEVARVARHARALLPAFERLSLDSGAPSPAGAPASVLIAERCLDKPIYRLEPSLIRKRSTEDSKPEFIHFAGRNVQEISIDNLQELLDYEKTLA